MATDEIEGMQAAVSVLSSKWSVAILAELADGTHRFNELLRHIDGISRRMLAATLRRLEHDGLDRTPRLRRRPGPSRVRPLARRRANSSPPSPRSPAGRTPRRLAH